MVSPSLAHLGDTMRNSEGNTGIDQTAEDRRAGLLPRDIGRRNLLRGLFLGLGAASVPAWVLESSAARAAAPGGPELDIPFGPLGAQDFGPLVKKVVEDDLTSIDHQLFAPEGFDVRVVMREGVNPVTKLASGIEGHIDPDGGAVYEDPDGNGWVYVSNSEHTPGGVSAIRFDASGAIVDYYRICEGTRNNCAGGKTPWGTWITCEEVTGGWCFETDPFATAASQRRLDGLGARNGREAIAIDPINHAIYQTLDTSSGKFVRFVSDPSDLEVTDGGVTRMRFETGVSQRLFIPEHDELPGYPNVTVPNNAEGSANLRRARPIQWLDDTGSNGTNFNGGEGIWYYEVPEALRTIPSAGTVPTRGVMFFASKGDNRIWAIDIENDLIELIYDTHNNQAFPNLRNTGGAASNFNQVDNVVVGPGGDVLVAEDGTAMRLAIMFNNQPAKLLMQITRGGSEICGPAFTPDGSRLYFSSQAGPSGIDGTRNRGVIYEMRVPPRFRAIQKANAIVIPERTSVAPGIRITSEAFTIDGFLGPMVLSITQTNGAQYSLDGAAWTSEPTVIETGVSLRVRHVSASGVDEVAETTVTVVQETGAGRTEGVFFSHTARPTAAERRVIALRNDVLALQGVTASTIERLLVPLDAALAKLHASRLETDRVLSQRLGVDAKRELTHFRRELVAVERERSITRDQFLMLDNKVPVIESML
jgi:hypothetical protein